MTKFKKNVQKLNSDVKKPVQLAKKSKNVQKIMNFSFEYFFELFELLCQCGARGFGCGAYGTVDIMNYPCRI